ncbi:unnamed protein product [Cylicostephanus goldi]|uniref:3-beta hydroxysteroid dehydrogenase/isomerase domain-containing protein n=1 Tax=Cylicostephanus goldi TaxID=71465 RepID=A0A3P7N9I1_CYLGO|nr:unnamed protein product [Cylicostephanus goldi]
MQRLGIETLVHVGDAYSALPIEDNYGLGELNFAVCGILPIWFFQAIIRATIFSATMESHELELKCMQEQLVKKILCLEGSMCLLRARAVLALCQVHYRMLADLRKPNDSFNAVFLRPVHIHGEQGSSSWFKLKEMTEQGNIPYVEGERRGMHQFIYAGNLAAIVDRCLSRLSADPKSLNGELVYCVDDTNVIPFREVKEY